MRLVVCVCVCCRIAILCVESDKHVVSKTAKGSPVHSSRVSPAAQLTARRTDRRIRSDAPTYSAPAGSERGRKGWKYSGTRWVRVPGNFTLRGHGTNVLRLDFRHLERFQQNRDSSFIRHVLEVIRTERCHTGSAALPVREVRVSIGNTSLPV